MVFFALFLAFRPLLAQGFTASISQTKSGVFDRAGEAGFTINYWPVTDSGKDSVDLLAKLLDRFDNRLRYVLVLNQLRGDDFSILKESGVEARAQSLGARTVSIKRLSEG